MPIKIESSGTCINNLAALSGIHLKNLLKCGITLIFGIRSSPVVGSALLNLKFGIWDDKTIAPALQPANEAPLCQFLTIACQIGVSIKVLAK